ncbi:MAG: LysM peptidoglycan-binding domain-containing protein [Burkholderiales bacterium]|nr:MAG: LysM peptidoglycan-binding domain-containing protein [Burkholderiales bacterium]
MQTSSTQLPKQQYRCVFKVLLASMAMCAMTHALARIDKPQEPFISYTVVKGDNIASISKKLLISPSEFAQLAKLNGIKNPALIQPGLVIDVPRSILKLGSQPEEQLTGVLESASGDVLINNKAAKAGDVVRQGDRVQTGAVSSATIKLADGSKVQWMPRTIAEVTQQSQYAMKDPTTSISTTWFSGTIRLVEGLLDIAAEKTTRRAQPFGVTTPTSVVGVRGTQFRVAYDDPASRSARTEVLEGKVRADNPAQAAGADVGGGFGTAFRPQDRQIKVVPLLPAIDSALLPQRILRPQPNANSEARVMWQLASLAGAVGYKTDVAKDEGFTQLVLLASAAQPQFDLSALPNGVYFARVRGFDAQKIEGYNAVRRIEIADAPVPPKPVVWIHNIGVAASAFAQGSDVVLQLSRQSADTPAQLTLEIAQDAGMTQALRQFPVDAQGRAVITPLPAGASVFVRVSSAAGSQPVQRSPVYLLRLPDNWGQTVQALSDALLPLATTKP